MWECKSSSEGIKHDSVQLFFALVTVPRLRKDWNIVHMTYSIELSKQSGKSVSTILKRFSSVQRQTSAKIFAESLLSILWSGFQSESEKNCLCNRSPGLRALRSRSSSSKAASTADFARFPVRVVDGSSKSILQIYETELKTCNYRYK